MNVPDLWIVRLIVPTKSWKSPRFAPYFSVIVIQVIVGVAGLAKFDLCLAYVEGCFQMQCAFVALLLFADADAPARS